jgi:hypothetical protein
MEFRELHHGIWVRILVDSTTGTYIGELMEVPGAPLIEAGSYDEIQGYLKQVVKDHLHGRSADFLEEWKQATLLEKDREELSKNQEAMRNDSRSLRNEMPSGGHNTAVEFRERYDGVTVKIRIDNATGTCIGELVDVPGAPLIEAGSYEEIRAHLKQAVTEHYSDSAVDFLKEWKRATRMQKEQAQAPAENEAA